MLQPQSVIDIVGTDWTSLDEIVSIAAAMDIEEGEQETVSSSSTRQVSSALTRAKVQMSLNAGVLRGELQRDANRRYRKV